MTLVPAGDSASGPKTKLRWPGEPCVTSLPLCGRVGSCRWRAAAKGA